jgi:hypothetical protein
VAQQQQQQQQEEQETDEAFYRKSLLCNRDKIFKQKLYYIDDDSLDIHDIEVEDFDMN